MSVDVVVTWPRHCDYPLWRRQILEQRDRFAQVLVAFTNHHGRHEYRGHVTAALGAAVTCFDAPDDGKRDWRDQAVNACLDRSDADWVWFTEQDLLIRRPGVFDRLIPDGGELGDYRAAGWREAGSDRWHPSCLIVRRDLIEQTDRYFGPVPIDHFWRFGRRLEALDDVYDLRDDFRFRSILDSDVDVVHMAGLSHNHALADAGREVTYKPNQFRAYLERCLGESDKLEPGWEARVRGYLDRQAR